MTPERRAELRAAMSRSLKLASESWAALCATHGDVKTEEGEA